MKDVDKEIGAAVEDDEKVGYDTKITHNIAFVYCHFGVRVLHCNSDDKLENVQASFEKMTRDADEDDGTENFRRSYIPPLTAVEIFKVLHSLLDNVVDFQVEEGKEKHWEDVEQNHRLDHVDRDVLCREPSIIQMSIQLIMVFLTSKPEFRRPGNNICGVVYGIQYDCF